jgi:transcriptional regulator with XRE-family HTH domain
MAELGARIRSARLGRGLSLDTIAGRAGVSRSMLSAVERGGKVPTVLVLDRIATALETSIARLLGEERAARVVVLRHAAQDVARDPSGWERRILSPALPGVASPPLVLYLSEEGHSCMRKAAEVLGLGADAVRTVPVDGDFRMDVGALRAAVTADRAAGRRPFCVAASAGTVSTGAIDPLDRVASVCQAEDLWFHGDRLARGS